LKKRILIFIDWFVPGYKAGGPISSNANLITHLKDDFEFYIITRDTDYCETKPYTSVVSGEWNELPTGAKVYYVPAAKLSIRNLIRISKTIDFDAVYVNGIYSLYFSLFPLIWFKYFSRKEVVVSARGMLSDHTFSSKKSKKKFFYTLSRFTGLYKGITFHATNDDEATQIRRNAGFKGVIKVAPNLPPVIQIPEKSTLKKTAGELRLISIARVSPEKNTLFALNILESCNLQPGTCNLVFDLYGTIYDQVYWYECQKIIARLPSYIKVNFCGTVEKEKIQETLQQYHFLFMPSKGENYGHSIVESFIAGCPVIISNCTPWRNLQKVHGPQSIVYGISPTSSGVGWDIALDQPEEFVKVIELCVLMDEHEYEDMSMHTLEYARKITNDPRVLEANRSLFA
jgi:glycosyltransferase involved in cell wall biosynthesis